MSGAMVLLLLAAAGQVAAPPAPPAPGNAQPTATMVYEPVAMAIAAFDADGDGRTTRAELTAGVARSVVTFDPGHTGALRFLDYGDWALRYLGDRYALPSPLEIDTDGDDRISLAELQAAFAAAFDRFDRDHDGVVTRAELLTVRTGGGGERGGPGGRPGRKPR